MSLPSLRRLRNTLSFRLTLWYFGLFTLSAVILFGTAYVLLAVTLQRKDRDAIQFELQEYVSEYQRGGLEAVEKEIALQQGHLGKVVFFVRVADPENRTLLLSIPSKWNRFDLTQLEKSNASADRQWILIPIKGDEDVLEIGSSRLPDGTLIEVGLNSEVREQGLEHFRNLLAVIMVPIVAIGLGGGVFFTLRALRPIRDLLQTLQSILSTGKLTARATVTETGDELDELSTLFNSMLDRIGGLITGMQGALDNVAHDLRTPMTRLRSMAEAALQTPTSTGDIRAALGNCMEESERILTMLNTLMDISEAETGTMRLELAEVNVHDLMRQAVELYEYVAEDKAITLVPTAPLDLVITADRNRLMQILANLLDNAIKYTPTGGQVTITATQNHQHVHIAVADTGVGVPPEDLPKIWDRLYRGDASRTQRGLGLGLSVVKAIVQAHHGEVAVSSQLGQGTRFSLRLPLTHLP
jgi:signal transduction histidine kinase